MIDTKKLHSAVLRWVIGYLKYLIPLPAILIYGWMGIFLISLVAKALAIPFPIDPANISMRCVNNQCDSITSLFSNRILYWGPVVALVFDAVYERFAGHKEIGWKKWLLILVACSTVFLGLVAVLLVPVNGTSVLVLIAIVWVAIQIITVGTVVVSHGANLLMKSLSSSSHD